MRDDAIRARIPGSLRPLPSLSSRATINNARDFKPSAGRFGAAPRNTIRSISPGADLIDASPAAAPPKTSPTTDTVFAPRAFR